MIRTIALAAIAVSVVSCSQTVLGDDADMKASTSNSSDPQISATSESKPDVDPTIRSTAVALNYCRASFHRIRKSRTKAVLIEEQEKILNNLNLSSVPDSEIITLYTSVLDEVNQVGLADYERRLLHDNYRSNVRRKMTWDALAFGTDLATAQFGNAVRTGANSWWDYRSTTIQRDVDVLKVDKARMSAVVSKSSQFLDTFWKLAQRKQIPDRMLVRGDDLDSLDQAVREPDGQVRLRILKRMSPFMEAYPPYWYYLGRTYQELGQVDDAIKTYDKLVAIGDRHFRKDDMLATGLANKAAIEEYLGRPDAVMTASRALEYSTEVWEANLICARVLQRHERYVAAEDAVLRNLDVGLETDQSRVFLVSVYYHAEDRTKLARVLADPKFASLPTPVLIRCASLLGMEATPSPVLQTVANSIDAQPHVTLGPDEIVLHASDAWQLPLAKMKATFNGEELTPAHASTINGGHELRLTARNDLGSPLGSVPDDWKLRIELTYPDSATVGLVLTGDPNQSRGLSTRVTAFRGPTSPGLRLSTIDVGEKRLMLAGVKTSEVIAPPAPTEGEESQFPHLMPIETGSE